MCSDPSPRNEMCCISRSLGAKAKISPIPGQSSVCQRVVASATSHLVPLLSHAPYPPPPGPRSLSERISCLSRVSPLGRWIPKAGERNVEPRVRLLPRGSPRGVQGLVRSSLRRECPLCGPRARGRSQEPQTCHAALRSTLWQGLCVYRRIKAGSQANSK